MILSGSQSGLSSIFRAIVGPGQPLLIESPTYWGAILAAAQADVTLIPIPSGPDGPDPDDVARAFDDTGARAFYVQPTYANPTGGQWSTERGRAVLDIVRARGAFLIEDDWAHDLSIDTDPHPVAAHDHDGHVIYLRSLTKSVSPSLRVAAVIARGPARDRIFADRGAESMYVSGLSKPPPSTSSLNPRGPRTFADSDSDSAPAATFSSTASASTSRKPTSTALPLAA